ncbi:cation diffusion facilitator family transporter [Jiulongibacter sediminis]|uniref:Cation diffusion facilitator family transporter n=1 Tax=Jiulongibacter sediminis TaxID=1605367 RepID=A0A0N8HA76_9BACT|nr:cation diffusion facilitator family transporter [Jiulongibacter sediminis]KPM49396.1 cation diffusion facilitator family transporter [Jiulongibacter sediminis]TBX26446.1 cation diffusion facilitator family transporter [Jiulongibacter sediminis]
MNSNKKAIGVSLIVGLLLMAIKFVAYYLTDSKAILTDALESVVNVAAAAFAFYSIYLASQPKDRNHPYGHGKVEFFSSGLEGTLIILAGLLMIGPTIYSFFVPNEVSHLNEGIWLVAITMVINAGVGLYLINIGKKNDSIALQADGKHLMVDALSTVILIAGLFLVKLTQKTYIDGILALILAVIIIYNGYRIVKKSISGLMDELDEKTFVQLLEILNKNREDRWIDVHNLRVQKYGPDIHVDCHLTLPYYLSLEDAHEEVTRFERMVQSNYPFEVEIFIHSDPCIPQCCHYCMIKNCSVRKEQFTGKKIWTEERILSNVKHFDY